MHHLATLSEGPFPGKPHRIQCACGTAGDFKDKTEAQDWFTYKHVARIGPTETSELKLPDTATAPSTAPPPPPPPVPFSADNQQPKENKETAT